MPESTNAVCRKTLNLQRKIRKLPGRKCVPLKRICICTVCIISLVLSSFLCGCELPPDNNDGVTVEMICTHLEKKYDDEFSLIEIRQGVDGGGKLTVWLSSKKFPDDRIVAKAVMEGYSRSTVGNEIVKVPIYTYEDNYAGYKHRSDFLDIATEYTQEIYGECKICYTVPDRTLPDGMGTIPFDCFITSMNAGLAYTIFLPPSAYSDDYKEKMECLYTKYAENFYQVDANVYYLSRQEDYDDITNDNYYTRITQAHADKEWYIVFGYYHLDGLMNASCEWRTGS